MPSPLLVFAAHLLLAAIAVAVGVYAGRRSSAPLRRSALRCQRLDGVASAARAAYTVARTPDAYATMCAAVAAARSARGAAPIAR